LPLISEDGWICGGFLMVVDRWEIREWERERIEWGYFGIFINFKKLYDINCDFLKHAGKVKKKSDVMSNFIWYWIINSI
jgi:hypothetical protein